MIHVGDFPVTSRRLPRNFPVMEFGLIRWYWVDITARQKLLLPPPGGIAIRRVCLFVCLLVGWFVRLMLCSLRCRSSIACTQSPAVTVGWRRAGVRPEMEMGHLSWPMTHDPWPVVITSFHPIRTELRVAWHGGTAQPSRSWEQKLYIKIKPPAMIIGLIEWLSSFLMSIKNKNSSYCAVISSSWVMHWPISISEWQRLRQADDIADWRR